MRQALQYSVLAFVLLMSVSSARADMAEGLLSTLEHTHWQELRGDARRIVASADNVIYALGRDERIYRWRTGRGWLALPGSFSYLALGADNKPWAIDTSGVVRRFNGLWWDEFPAEFEPRLLAASASDERIFVLSNEGQAFYWSDKEESWLPFTDSNVSGALSFVVDKEQVLWVVNSGGELHSYQGDQRTSYGTRFDEVAISSQGIVLAINRDGKIIAPATPDKSAVAIDHIARSIAFAKGNAPWLVDDKGRIYTTSSLLADTEEPEADVVPVTAGENAAVADSEIDERNEALVALETPNNNVPDELRFIRVRDARLNALEISSNGSVFGLNQDKQIVRWSNRTKSFSSFPGTADKITTDVSGQLWVVNPLGDVYRLEDTRWEEINNISASDIVATPQGEVYVLSSSGAVYRFNSVNNRFERIPRLVAKDIASDNAGTVWVLDDRQRLLTCTTEGCDSVPAPKIQSIDIGEGGNFYIVTTNNQLYRRNTDVDEEADDWQFIRRHVTAVSVGPDGYPWILDTEGRVYYSALFERDETRDRRFALSITGDTSGRSESINGIQIVRSMRFTQVNLPAVTGSDIRLESHGSGALYVAGYQVVSSGTGPTTYVNTFCLSNPLDQVCGMPDVCPDTQVDGCQPCDTLINQSDSLVCTAVTNASTEPAGTWVNGYCLAFPNDPACGGLPGQGSIAPEVDCTQNINQTSTVCVRYENSVDVGSAVPEIQSLWRYDISSRRFREIKKRPDNSIDFTEESDERLAFLTASETLQRETSPGSGRYRPEPWFISGNNSTTPSISAGGGTLYALNSANRLFQRSESSAVESELLDIPLVSIAADDSGRLWAISNNRVVLCSEDGTSLESVHNSAGLDTLVTTITGEVYLLINQAIYRLNRTTDRLEKIQGNYGTVRSLGADSQGKLWVITTANKLYKQI